MSIDYEASAESLVLPAFKETNITGVVKSLVSPLQEISDTSYQVAGAYDVRTAVGVQLDSVGKLLNVDREGMTDDEYREKIKARLLINNSKGTSSDFISLLKLVLGDITFKVIEDPSAPAQVQVIIYSPQTVINEQLVNDITPIGVRGVFFQNPYEGKTIFELGDVSDDNSTITGGTPLPNVADLDTTDVVLLNIIYF